ncbi:MAG: MATE family efflux transporter [Rikenellaceae bacterium]|nr:MATE family efflux transporter [Rikenellaceae bacterium]
MNKEIFRIAIPNIISNITVPLMGLVSTAIVGRWSGDAAVIGALALGVSIFNFIYWNCSFIRMGTSGLTAQAYGAGNFHETTAMLVRAVVISLAMGVACVILQRPLGALSLWLMNGDGLVADYFYARIWAMPAGILLFGIYGWFVGMQNATIPMTISIIVNSLHIVVGYWFVFSYDMGIVGIAYASVVSQWIGLALAVLLILLFFRKTFRPVKLAEVLKFDAMRRFFSVNGDIIVRTFCNVGVYTFFTAASARMGNDAVLAVNTVLMQCLMLFSYMSDGFAYAAEAMTGRFVGAKDLPSLKRCLRYCVIWTFTTAAIAVTAYVVGWDELFVAFMESGSEADIAEILKVAERYVGWIIAIPIFAAMPFMLDGVMAGATLTRVMRNSMFWATVAFFAIYYALLPVIGNDALWLAFTLYIILRLVLQYFMSHRLEDIYKKAER